MNLRNVTAETAANRIVKQQYTSMLHTAILYLLRKGNQQVI